MGEFQALYDLLAAPLRDAETFLQTISLLVACVMALYYKLREMFAGVQEDQMFSQKTKKVFFALGFIFLIPTIIKAIEAYLRINTII
ncbi:MAG: hypothetical protein HUJ76_04820 [Parasporobacterium sp.]|nr:hypothetical protein [Holdemanella sp.]MCF0228998.1 hypothetical protein [Parasporobacterium sp.]